MNSHRILRISANYQAKSCRVASRIRSPLTATSVSSSSLRSPTMSWQAYVDTNLIGTGKVTKAAILGQSGGIWAHSQGFQLPVDEQEAVVAAYGRLPDIQANGIKLAGVKYFTISADERSIYGKKALDGCVIVKTKQAILVGTYSSPIQQTECTTILEGLADYLIGLGY